jgi:sugar phosphate isomerase/epimerase
VEPEPVLLATCWTAAGDAAPYPGRHTSPIDLRTRIEAAARAGFRGFGILDFDLRAFLQTSDLTTLAQILADNGMADVELELLTQWWATGSAREASNRVRALLLEAAGALGAHHIKIAAAVEDPSAPDVSVWADALHDLADEALQHGTRVALEFMPFTNVATLALAAEIVEAADHPAAGLLLDVWHLERTGISPTDLSSIPLETIFAVELDDGSMTPVGDPYDDTCLRRLLPGEGEFRIAAYAAQLMSMGYSLPWGVEIISDTYRLRELDDALPDVVRHTREQLALARELVREGTTLPSSGRGVENGH